MPSFRDTFMRLGRRTRPRQPTGASTGPAPEAATPAQPTQARDGRQTHGESLEQTQDRVIRNLIDRLEGRNSHVRNIEAEAARLWAETVIMETERQASHQARSGSGAASRWGNTVGPIALRQILVDDNADENGNGNGNGNHRNGSNGLGNGNGRRPPTSSQSREEGRSNDDIDFESSPALAHIGEHIMRVFNDLSTDEQPAMAAWIILMAAAQIRRDLERAGDQDELAYRHPD